MIKLVPKASYFCLIHPTRQLSDMRKKETGIHLHTLALLLSTFLSSFPSYFITPLFITPPSSLHHPSLLSPSPLPPLSITPPSYLLYSSTLNPFTLSLSSEGYSHTIKELQNKLVAQQVTHGYLRIFLCTIYYCVLNCRSSWTK